jgi:hypothetical protein
MHTYRLLLPTRKLKKIRPDQRVVVCLSDFKLIYSRAITMSLIFKIFGLAMLVISCPVSAGGSGNALPGHIGQAQADQGQNFEQHKQRVLSRMQQNISTIQTNIACVQNAANHDALRSCQEAAKAVHDAMRAQHEKQDANMQPGKRPKPD